MSIVRPDYEPDYYCESGVKELRYWWTEMVMESIGFGATLHKLVYFQEFVWVMVYSPDGESVQLSKLQSNRQDHYQKWLAKQVVE